MIATLILAAGLGTRLGALSQWRAKPLLPVGDRPAIAHVVDRVRAVSRVVVVNAFHRAHDVQAFARANGLAVSLERDLAGTAGAMHHASGALGDGDVLVWNGDMIGPLDAARVVEAHAKSAADGAVATLVVRKPSGGRALGNVGLDAAGRVVRIRGEAPAAGEASCAEFVGIYVIGRELRRAFPALGGVIEDVLLPAMAKGARVRAVVTDAPLVDIGTPSAYLEANLAWLAARGEAAWAAGAARVAAGVTLDHALVGAGARVDGEGRVASSVVWPDATVHAPIANAIVAAEGVVRIGG